MLTKETPTYTSLSTNRFLPYSKLHHLRWFSSMQSRFSSCNTNYSGSPNTNDL